ncbi:mycofactocin precursor MftA [Nocardioides sp. AN3]
MSAQTTTAQTSDQATAELTADALIEEVSIDGMCGVY